MKLITYDGIDLKVTDEAFLVRPIRELFQKDKSKNHEEFFRQMSYMWFMYDPRSTYMYLTDESERAEEVKAQEGFDKDWEPSELLKDAISSFKRHTVTTSSLLIEDIRISIDNVRKFLRDVDPGAVNDKGTPLYQIGSITKALKEAIELSRMLGEAEKALAQDYEKEESARGQLMKSAYEDY